jgi:hypothetical protein
MSAVGVHPSQLTIVLEMLDESKGIFQRTTVKNLFQKYELLHQKEIGIDLNILTSKKAVEFCAKNDYRVLPKHFLCPCSTNVLYFSLYLGISFPVQ